MPGCRGCTSYPRCENVTVSSSIIDCQCDQKPSRTRLNIACAGPPSRCISLRVCYINKHEVTRTRIGRAQRSSCARVSHTDSRIWPYCYYIFHMLMRRVPETQSALTVLLFLQPAYTFYASGNQFCIWSHRPAHILCPVRGMFVI